MPAQIFLYFAAPEVDAQSTFFAVAVTRFPA
jgi:hypothetical protein